MTGEENALYYMRKKGVGQVYAYSLRAESLKEARRKARRFYGTMRNVEVWIGPNERRT